MNQDIRNLEPQSVWNNFSDLNRVPRASKKEGQVIEFMVNFGKNLGLETIVDNIGNVIIKKPATVGMENRKTVVLQSHLDMVHQKNSSSNFDFGSQGIKMLIKDDWVTADDTTLGADNGMGVAAIMSVLQATELSHPNIEALFTIDEETGMTGAFGLESGYLNGEILLNLDTEEDDEIDIGCAGGIDITANRDYAVEKVTNAHAAYKISITGLLGGHSGMDIHKGLANSNIMMNQILKSVEDLIQIAQINGGSLRNAIPRESLASIIIEENKDREFLSRTHEISKSISQDLSHLEKKLKIQIEPITTPDQMMSKKDQSQLIHTLDKAFNGVYNMSKDMLDLVETSNNIAKVTVENGSIKIECLTRSSSEHSKTELANLLKTGFEAANFEVILSGSYPGWQPNPKSPILNVLKEIYTNSFGLEPKIGACHAGLECGILAINYPKMDMISFGPTIQGAHSPDERVSISSTQKFWSFLKKILANIPIKSDT